MWIHVDFPTLSVFELLRSWCFLVMFGCVDHSFAVLSIFRQFFHIFSAFFSIFSSVFHFVLSSSHFAEVHLGLDIDCQDMTQEDWKRFLLASSGTGPARHELEKLLEKPELLDSASLDLPTCFETSLCYTLFDMFGSIVVAWVHHGDVGVLVPRHCGPREGRLFGLRQLPLGSSRTPSFAHHDLSRNQRCHHLCWGPSAEKCARHVCRCACINVR